MDVLKTILSVIVGILGAVFAAAAFIVSVFVMILRYLVTMLIGLLMPKLRYAARLNWMLADAEKDNPRLRTGLLRRVKMQGAGSDTVFRSMRESIRQYRAQKRRRRGISDRSVLSGIFEKYDSIYYAYLKQFGIAAESVDWSKTDIYNWETDPAFRTMRQAAEGLQTMISEHEKTLTNALHQDVHDTVSVNNIQQDMEYLHSFNDTQNEHSEPAEQPEQSADQHTQQMQ